MDANILMYSAGAEHENKGPSIEFLHRVADGEIAATVDAEVLQEIIHRYRALRRWPERQKVYELARSLFPDVLPITAGVMDCAKQLVDEHPAISACDAIHAAVVSVYKLEGIYSFDSDFDRIRGCRRIRL